MAADTVDEYKFKITGDASEYQKAVADAKGSTDGLAEAVTNRLGREGRDAFGMLSEALSGEMVAALGVAALAVAAIKKDFDFTLEAERIEQINRSFDALAASAHLAGDQLKSSLEGASHGLADTESILEASNRAIVQLGNSAKILPQTMELARKATALFGGDLVANFEAFNSALAAGNVRALRQFGIIVNADQATKAYAKSLGVTTDVLTEHGRKQAIMNAALEAANEKFKNVNESVSPATIAQKQLNVALTEAAESFKTAVAQSELFKKALDYVRDAAIGAKIAIDGGDQLRTTKMIQLSNSMQAMDAERRKLEKELSKSGGLNRSEIQHDLDLIKIDYNKARAQYLQMQEEMHKASQKTAENFGAPTLDKENGGGGAGASSEELNFNRQLYAKKLIQAEEYTTQLQTTLNQSNQAKYALDLDYDRQTQELDQAAQEQKLLVFQEFEEKKRALIAENSDPATALLNQRQLADAEVALELQKQARIAAILTDTERRHREHLKAMTDGVNDFYKKAVSGAIQSFGASLVKGQSAFGNFQKQFLSMLGDLSIMLGEHMIFTGKGILSEQSMDGSGSIAAGVGLIALGGILKSLGDTSSGASSAGGGIAGSSANAGGAITSAPTAADAKPLTMVTLNIQGNVLDRRATGLEIVDILNEHFSANDGRMVRTA